MDIEKLKAEVIINLQTNLGVKGKELEEFKERIMKANTKEELDKALLGFITNNEVKCPL